MWLPGAVYNVIMHDLTSSPAPAARMMLGIPSSLKPQDFSPGRRMYHIKSKEWCHRVKEAKGEKNAAGLTQRKFVRVGPKAEGRSECKTRGVQTNFIDHVSEGHKFTGACGHGTCFPLRNRFTSCTKSSLRASRSWPKAITPAYIRSI